MFLEQVALRNTIERHTKLTWCFVEQYEASLNLPPVPDEQITCSSGNSQHSPVLCAVSTERGVGSA